MAATRRHTQQRCHPLATAPSLADNAHTTIGAKKVVLSEAVLHNERSILTRDTRPRTKVSSHAHDRSSQGNGGRPSIGLNFQVFGLRASHIASSM